MDKIKENILQALGYIFAGLFYLIIWYSTFCAWIKIKYYRLFKINHIIQQDKFHPYAIRIYEKK
jgi:hypothetical protein